MTRKFARATSGKRLPLTAILLVIAVLGMIYILYPQSPGKDDTRQQELTQVHAEEIVQAIENFHIVFDSQDIRKEPELYSQILAGQYLQEMLSIEPRDNDEVIVTDTADVTGLRVLDYSSSSFRTIGCLTLQQSLMSIIGEHIRSFRPREVRWLYAFVLEDEIWKVSAQTYIGDTELLVQNWNEVSNWERELLGDLSDFINKTCFSVS